MPGVQGQPTQQDPRPPQDQCSPALQTIQDGFCYINSNVSNRFNQSSMHLPTPGSANASSCFNQQSESHLFSDKQVSHQQYHRLPLLVEQTDNRRLYSSGQPSAHGEHSTAGMQHFTPALMNGMQNDSNKPYQPYSANATDHAWPGSGITGDAVRSMHASPGSNTNSILCLLRHCTHVTYKACFTRACSMMTHIHSGSSISIF